MLVCAFQGYPYGRAADWWSLGVTLYRFCTGRLPFRGQTEQELQDKVCSNDVNGAYPLSILSLENI